MNFNEQQLAKALAIRDQSYQLLIWMSELNHNRLIQPSLAAHFSGGPEVVAQWLKLNSKIIPQRLRPPEDDLRQFSAFFSTYLTSSFDVVIESGSRRAQHSPITCNCDICIRMIDACHLRTKKVYSRHKRRANFLMTEYVQSLALHYQLSIDENAARLLVMDQAIRRSAAYGTYGEWLIQRLTGESDGASILALWRLIAWHPSGGVRRSFKLKLDDFVDAEERVVLAVRKAAEASSQGNPVVE